MKRATFLFLVFISAIPAGAQTTVLSGRYSNYATDIDLGLATLETGRGSSIGFLANYRNGGFVLNAQLDHDFDNGVSFLDFLPFELAEYSRDRAEATVGYSVIPMLDVEAGIRLDQMDIETSLLDDDDFFGGVDLEHQAIVGGVTFHSPTIRPVGWYASLRGYFGSAEFNFEGVDVTADTIGFKAEAGVPIPIGVTGWEITPGLELERLTTDDFAFGVGGLEFDTNRFFINVGYALGR